MVSVLDVSVTDARAQKLLADYFDARAAGHPGGRDAYRTVVPDPAHFEPPLGAFVIVLDSAGEPIGCGGVRRVDVDVDRGEPGAVRFEVKHLWIAPRIRGTGAGRLLLLELERRARDLGASELVLDTNASLIAATRLYRTGGYEEVAPYNDNPNATNWFWKSLTAPRPED
jgi:GNAT superfamily N-acetyltransferase